jgi:membrane protein YdbS with pleckstrin-like domain
MSDKPVNVILALVFAAIWLLPAVVRRACRSFEGALWMISIPGGLILLVALVIIVYLACTRRRRADDLFTSSDRVRFSPERRRR